MGEDIVLALVLSQRAQSFGQVTGICKPRGEGVLWRRHEACKAVRRQGPGSPRSAICFRGLSLGGRLKELEQTCHPRRP